MVGFSYEIKKKEELLNYVFYFVYEINKIIHITYKLQHLPIFVALRTSRR